LKKEEEKRNLLMLHKEFGGVDSAQISSFLKCKRWSFAKNIADFE
jgi:hypothetical protein